MNPEMQFHIQLTIIYYVIKGGDTLYAYGSIKKAKGVLEPIHHAQFPNTEDGAAQAEAWCWEQREKDMGNKAKEVKK